MMRRNSASKIRRNSASGAIPSLGKEVNSKSVGRFSLRKSNADNDDANNNSNGDLLELNFSDIPLVGREEELNILKDAFTSCLEGKGTRVVLVDGDSGMGKTALVDHFVKQCLPENAYLARAKFNQHVTDEPHSALKSILSQLLSKILNEEGTSKRESRKSTLLSVIPIVTQFVNQNNPHKNEEAAVISACSASEAFNQLQFVLGSFIACVCSSEHPIILWLDDLQWADDCTLKLVEAVVKSTETHNLLLIGGCRGNEVDKLPLVQANSRRKSSDTETSLTRHLASSITSNTSNSSSFRKKPEASSHRTFRRISKGGNSSTAKLSFKGYDRISRIQLSNLDLDGVNKIVAKLTKYDYDLEKTKPLANIVFQRTHGNAFFCKQFLSMLQKEEMLYYSLRSYQWEWEDIQKIEEKTSSTDNVVDVVAKNIERLPENLKPIIKVASCFRSSFTATMLEDVLQNLDLNQNDDKTPLITSTEELLQNLEKASEAGVIRMTSSKNVYRFSHDRIMSVAYTCLSEEQEREQLHIRIGELMKQIYVSDTQKESWKLFVATNQLNLGSAQILGKTERKSLAKMNLQAGENAISSSSFVLAAKYLDYGIALLDKDTNWNEDYDLSLNLYSAAVEMAFCNGNFDEYEHIAEEVLVKGRCFRDKLRVYTSCVDMLGARKRHEDAIELGFQILADLGEKFPKRPSLIHVIGHLTKTKSMLRGKTDEDLMELSRMTDEDKIAAMKMLKSITTHVYVLHKMEYFALILFRMMQLSLRHGLSNVSPLAFASYGVMLRGMLGDIKGGYRYGKLALELVDRLDARETEAQVLMVTNIFLNHWQKPLHDSIDPLLHGHRVGMECGDTEYALYCANIYLQLYFYTGLPLQPYERDLNDFCMKMDEYKQEATLHVTLPYWQCALNLMGRAEKDPTELTGEVMDQAEYLETSEESNDERAKQIVLSLRLQLGYYFGDLDLAQNMSKKLWKDFESKEEDTSLTSYGLTFYSALVSLEMARHKKTRKHKAHARKCIKKMESYVNAGAINYVHKLLLLQAEYASLYRNASDEIKKMFEAAISAASRSGFVQDCALANERAGIFFGDFGDQFWASEYLTCAHELYEEYGAKAKANQLETSYPAVFSTRKESTRQVQTGSFLKGRRRFSNKVFELLQSDPAQFDENE